MAKKKLTIKMHSYGLYSKWERESKDLPKLIKITETIEAAEDIEFGYVLHFKGAKGAKIEFVMHHPPFKDDNGVLSPPFTGEYYINANDFLFFLGDTVWLPIDDKKGDWRLVCRMEGKIIADKTLTLI